MDWGFTDELIGTTLAERYRIERYIGKGGFGVVFAGTHTWLDVPIAIKFLRLDRIAESEQAIAFDNFLAEARTLAQLRHDHIVRVIDTGVRHAQGELPRLPWLVMEWCAGPTLAEKLRSQAGGRSRAATWKIMKPVIAAVAHAHDRGVVHRDLKPANIMFVDDSPRVVDFGIAKLLEADEQAAQDLASTRSDRRAFTPAYAAPEQLTGRRTGPWTDVHALALITTELLTGQRAFGAVDSAELMRAQLQEDRPTPAAYGVDAGDWEPVLARAMAFSSSERHAHAAELLAALGEHVDDLGGDDVTSGRAPLVGTDTEPDTGLQTGEPLALPRPTTLRRPAISRAQLVGSIVAMSLFAGVAWWAARSVPEDGTAVAVSSAAPTPSPAPSPAGSSHSAPRVVAHPHDGYSRALVEARLRDAGWRLAITEESDRMRWNATVRIVATAKQDRAAVLLHGFRESAFLARAEKQMRAMPELVIRRRGGMLMTVHVMAGAITSGELIEQLARTAPAANVGGAAIPLSTPRWERFDTPAGSELRDVWGFDQRRVYAVGAHGVIIRFDGERWHREASGVSHDLLALWGMTPHVYAVGRNGTILRRDSGRWTVEPSGTERALLAIGGSTTGRDTHRVLAGGQGGVLLERIDGTWTSSTQEAKDDIVRVGSGRRITVSTRVGATYEVPELGELIARQPWPTDEHGLPSLFLPDPMGNNVTHNHESPWPAAWSAVDWSPSDYVRMAGEALVVGSDGIIFQAKGGVFWDKTELGVANDLNGVWVAADGSVFAVGNEGTALRRRPQWQDE